MEALYHSRHEHYKEPQCYTVRVIQNSPTTRDVPISVKNSLIGRKTMMTIVLITVYSRFPVSLSVKI